MGSLGDRFGRLRALQAGLVVFGLASLAAAYSQTTGQLIAARAAQGIGGAMIMLGLYTRYAAFLASGLMAFAYVLGHATRLGDDQPIWHALMPLANRGETAVLFCFVFLYIAAKGNGICSLSGDED